MRGMTRGRISLFGLAVLASLAIGGYGAVLFGPIQWHYLLVKKCAKDALLEYRVSGTLSSAKTQLKSSFYREGVPDYLDPKRTCRFRDSRRELNITCSWQKDVFIPGIEKTVTRRFNLNLSIDESGVIEQF